MPDPRCNDPAADLWPPQAVRLVTDSFLAAVDEELPDLVEGLYLHGSLGFGEWYDGRSDVDFVAVLAERPDQASVERLREVHARIGETFPRPPYDGFYLTWDDLARSPHDCPDVPCILGRDFREEGRFDVNPVTWHELAGHGVTVRGPALETVAIWTDQQALRDYTHENLRCYWAKQAGVLKRFPQEAAKPDLLAWFVLSTSRLHHLLATNRLTSKTGAGRYALEVFDERWRPIVEEAIAIRERGVPGASYPGDRGQDVADFSDMVIRTGLAMEA